MTPTDEMYIAFAYASALIIGLFCAMLLLWDWLEHDGVEQMLRAVHDWLAYLRYRMGKDLDPRD